MLQWPIRFHEFTESLFHLGKKSRVNILYTFHRSTPTEIGANFKPVEIGGDSKV